MPEKLGYHLVRWRQKMKLMNGVHLSASPMLLSYHLVQRTTSGRQKRTGSVSTGQKDATGPIVRSLQEISWVLRISYQISLRHLPERVTDTDMALQTRQSIKMRQQELIFYLSSTKMQILTFMEERQHQQ